MPEPQTSRSSSGSRSPVDPIKTGKGKGKVHVEREHEPEPEPTTIPSSPTTGVSTDGTSPSLHDLLRAEEDYGTHFDDEILNDMPFADVVPSATPPTASTASPAPSSKSPAHRPKKAPVTYGKKQRTAGPSKLSNDITADLQGGISDDEGITLSPWKPKKRDGPVPGFGDVQPAKNLPHHASAVKETVLVEDENTSSMSNSPSTANDTETGDDGDKVRVVPREKRTTRSSSSAKASSSSVRPQDSKLTDETPNKKVTRSSSKAALTEPEPKINSDDAAAATPSKPATPKLAKDSMARVRKELETLGSPLLTGNGVTTTTWYMDKSGKWWEDEDPDWEWVEMKTVSKGTDADGSPGRPRRNQKATTTVSASTSSPATGNKRNNTTKVEPTKEAEGGIPRKKSKAAQAKKAVEFPEGSIWVPKK